LMVATVVRYRRRAYLLKYQHHAADANQHTQIHVLSPQQRTDPNHTIVQMPQQEMYDLPAYTREPEAIPRDGTATTIPTPPPAFDMTARRVEGEGETTTTTGIRTDPSHHPVFAESELPGYSLAK
ncbi:hypothetical protein HKX48_000167, partial [Thoreauomyces humboldtii]